MVDFSCNKDRLVLSAFPCNDTLVTSSISMAEVMFTCNAEVIIVDAGFTRIPAVEKLKFAVEASRFNTEKRILINCCYTYNKQTYIHSYMYTSFHL